MKKMLNVSIIVIVMMFVIIGNSFAGPVSDSDLKEIKTKSLLFIEMMFTSNEELVDIVAREYDRNFLYEYLYKNIINTHNIFSRWAGKTWTQEKSLRELSNTTIDFSNCGFEWDEGENKMKVEGKMTIIRPTFGKKIEKCYMIFTFIKEDNEWFIKL